MLASAIRDDDWPTVRLAILEGAGSPTQLMPSQEARLRRERASVALYDAARQGDAAAIRRLVREGADPNIALDMDDHATPLAWAAACNRTEAIHELLAQGAHVDQSFTWSKGRAIYDSTALMFASFYGSTDAMAALISSGADVNRATRVTSHDDPNEVDEWPLVEAAGTQDARALLIAAGARTRD